MKKLLAEVKVFESQNSESCLWIENHQIGYLVCMFMMPPWSKARDNLKIVSKRILPVLWLATFSAVCVEQPLM